MTNKLVVIINSLKVPKIKTILLYEIKFLVPNYSCLQNPWLGGYCPQIPILSVLCPQLNLLNPPEQNSWVRHWHISVGTQHGSFISQFKSVMNFCCCCNSVFWDLYKIFRSTQIAVLSEASLNIHTHACARVKCRYKMRSDSFFLQV